MGVTQKVGSLGEELVVRFLVKRGYKILDRNYRKPWGELDIVAERKGKLHFVEVKTLSQRIVSDETQYRSQLPQSSLQAKGTEGTSLSERERSLRYIRTRVKKDRFRAEDHVNAQKLKRLGRIIQTYLYGKRVSDETNWQFDVATVALDRNTKKAKIELLESLTLN